jgi:hypothetical protein
MMTNPRNSDAINAQGVMRFFKDKFPVLNFGSYFLYNRKRDRGFLGKVGLRRTSHEQDLIASINEIDIYDRDAFVNLAVYLNHYKREITKFNHLRTYSSNAREKRISDILTPFEINLKEKVTAEYLSERMFRNAQLDYISSVEFSQMSV